MADLVVCATAVCLHFLDFWTGFIEETLFFRVEFFLGSTHLDLQKFYLISSPFKSILGISPSKAEALEGPALHVLP